MAEKYPKFRPFEPENESQLPLIRRVVLYLAEQAAYHNLAPDLPRQLEPLTLSGQYAFLTHLFETHAARLSPEDYQNLQHACHGYLGLNREPQPKKPFELTYSPPNLQPPTPPTQLVKQSADINYPPSNPEASSGFRPKTGEILWVVEAPNEPRRSGFIRKEPQITLMCCTHVVKYDFLNNYLEGLKNNHCPECNAPWRIRSSTSGVYEIISQPYQRSPRSETPSPPPRPAPRPPAPRSSLYSSYRDTGAPAEKIKNKLCPNCGSPIPAAASFCRRCSP